MKITGATVHYVNEIPDGGEIIMQKSVAVCKGDDPEKLQKRVLMNAEWDILPKATEQLARQIILSKEKKAKDGDSAPAKQEKK